MKREIKAFRDVLAHNIFQRIKARFDNGEFDMGIEAFLKGKAIEITIANTFDGSKLSEITKSTIAALPTEDAIRRFDELVNLAEKKPVKVVDESKKGR